MNLKNKVILITGASSGIGEAVAKKFADEGALLALAARRKDMIDKIAQQLELKTRVAAYKCDVTNLDEVRNVYRQIKVDCGKVDIAFLNSGVSFRSGIKEFDSVKAKQTFDTNVMGLINFIEVLLPDFISEKNGVIVGVSSLADSRGFPKSGFYCASKAAASIFLESLRIELKPYNVKVITVRPGFVKTPMTDKNEFFMPFLMEPEKAADIIVKEIKKEKSRIQFPLAISLAVRLLRIIPDSLFEYLASREPIPRK
ncbi:SDR family NAD(P)-dependent oxidoreductase [Ignavibacterium sp.]|uniref:SDR family NAD(P)-dependent oxidoreductase n=1 Tax=Ignavibacterium sp. TaxID=2651167 RepID=UPI0021FDCC8A|nr:SDR family NAD(P)-dependent oxidoreductase [Ignavibacterium sp.]BDQ03241.1 MAG: short-chain dehydrogenase [Ignavibacterium sp.]